MQTKLSPPSFITLFLQFLLSTFASSLSSTFFPALLFPLPFQFSPLLFSAQFLTIPFSPNSFKIFALTVAAENLWRCSTYVWSTRFLLRPVTLKLLNRFWRYGSHFKGYCLIFQLASFLYMYDSWLLRNQSIKRPRRWNFYYYAHVTASDSVIKILSPRSL